MTNIIITESKALQLPSLDVLVECAHDIELIRVDHQDGKLNDLLRLNLYSVQTGRFEVQNQKMFKFLLPKDTQFYEICVGYEPTRLT